MSVRRCMPLPVTSIFLPRSVTWKPLYLSHPASVTTWTIPVITTSIRSTPRRNLRSGTSIRQSSHCQKYTNPYFYPRYNDISPLENHHCSVAFRILENEDCNIFKSFSSDMFKQVREGMIRCILATDMARHNEILAQFKDITPIFDYTNKAHVNSVIELYFHLPGNCNDSKLYSSALHGTHQSSGYFE